MLEPRKIWMLSLAGAAMALLCLLSLPQAEGQESADVYLPYVPAADSAVTIDGMISSREYDYSYTDPVSGMVLYLEHDKTDMNIAMVSPGLGWVGIGFAPEGSTRMIQGNLILGWVTNDVVQTFDGLPGLKDNGYSFDADTIRNGTDDIIEANVTEMHHQHQTIFEFSYPLKTNDTNDHNLSVNSPYTIFISYADSADDDDVAHTTHSPVLTLFVMENETQSSSISLNAPGAAFFAGSATTVTANVQLEGVDMEHGTVTFYRKTSFGELPLGTVPVANGQAEFQYTPTIIGEFELKAQLNAAVPLYFDSEDTLSITVAGEPEDHVEYTSNSEIGHTWKNRYIISILVVAGSVWIVILSSVNLALNIQAAGEEEEETEELAEEGLLEEKGEPEEKMGGAIDAEPEDQGGEQE